MRGFFYDNKKPSGQDALDSLGQTLALRHRVPQSEILFYIIIDGRDKLWQVYHYRESENVIQTDLKR